MNHTVMPIAPDPRFVWLIDYAIDAVSAKVYDKGRYDFWFKWAAEWKGGERSPAACVDTAHRCFKDKGDPVNHALGQIAWAAKEACYSLPASGWLALRYVADAMVAFGAAFPEGFVSGLGDRFLVSRHLEIEKGVPIDAV